MVQANPVKAAKVCAGRRALFLRVLMASNFVCDRHRSTDCPWRRARARFEADTNRPDLIIIFFFFVLECVLFLSFSVGEMV